MLTKQARKAFQEVQDAKLVKMVVCNMVPPLFIKSPEFLDYSNSLNSSYTPPSVDRFTETLVPTESVRIKAETIEELQRTRFLTISFDGGATREPRGFYSVHVRRPSGRVHLLELDDGSRLSHTGRYIFEIMERVSYLLFVLACWTDKPHSGSCASALGTSAPLCQITRRHARKGVLSPLQNGSISSTSRMRRTTWT